LGSAKYNSFGFESKIPIPSYLIAIVAGNIVQTKISSRTYVISEPGMADAAA